MEHESQPQDPRIEFLDHVERALAREEPPSIGNMLTFVRFIEPWVMNDRLDGFDALRAVAVFKELIDRLDAELEP